MFYSAAWTDSGLLLGCSHEHETIANADSCIPCAGGYVVAVEKGAMRSLTAKEEAEFQRVHYAPRTDNPEVATTPAAPEEAAVSDSRYAIMTRIRVGDRWTWATWMCFLSICILFANVNLLFGNSKEFVMMGMHLSAPTRNKRIALSLVIIQNAASSPQVKVTETRVADLYRRVGRDCVSNCY